MSELDKLDVLQICSRLISFDTVLHSSVNELVDRVVSQMMAESVDIPKEQVALDHPSVEMGPSSINVEQCEVEIRDSSSKVNSRPKSLSPEQLAEVKRKSDKVETDKYFAIKV